MKITMILCLLVGGLCASFAQGQIRGTVTDIHGQPVSGATIKGRDGNMLAFTDSLGRFSLKEPLPRSITVSHVSYRDSEADISPRHTGILDIMLGAKETLIEEVEISTGFQRIPKERATGAFSYIDNETFNEQVSTDVLSRLEAVANGLNMERVATSGSDMGIRIRGLSTLSTGTIRDPLIILNNFPYEGDLNNINPNDVESVTLLKDAAAASIWGARAGNGVIVITTKRGKRNQPLRIDVNSNLTVGKKADLNYYPLMSSGDFIEAERFLFGNGHRFSETVSANRPPFSPVYEILFRQQRDEINETQADALLAELARIDVRDQYSRYMYVQPVRQQYAINLQGSQENTTWYMSAGHDRNLSTTDAFNERSNFNFRNTYTPTRTLQLEVGLMHTQSRSVNGHSGYSVGSIPYTRIADEYGVALPLVRDYRQPFLDTLGQGTLLDWNYYPLTDHQNIDNRSSLVHTLVNAGINYKWHDWLSLDVKYQFGQQQVQNENLNGEGSYFTRNLINQFAQPLPATGDVAYRIPRGGILDLSRSYLQSHNLRGQANIHQKWSLHEVSVLVGAEASHVNTNQNSNRTYGYNADVLTFNHVDYLNRYPSLISNNNLFIPQNHNFEDQTRRFVSAFANGGYTYKDRYVLTLSGRRDASNQFGVNFNDRWNLLWSAGFSWEVSQERFYRVGALPYLRFRATYGYSGNTDMARSAVTTIQYAGNSPFISSPSSIISQHANPELGWEKVRMVNLATDFRLKGNRLSGNVDLFYKKGTDLFGIEPMDYTTGISAGIISNVSELRGSGVDVELNSINLEGRLKWSSNLNFSFYDDKVTRYYRQSTDNMSLFVNSTVSGMTLVEGERLYSMYAYRWGGLDSETGDPIGYINSQQSKQYSAIVGSGSTMADVVNFGSRVPRFYGTLGNSFSYKNFGLTIRILYKFGYFVREEGVRYSTLLNGMGNAIHEEYGQRWKMPGDELFTNVPSLIYPNPTGRDNFYNLSEIRVERGDHIRLQYLSLHYEFVGGEAPLRLPFRRFRIYANASNFGVLWRASQSGTDPEYGWGVIPTSPVYSLGLRFNF